MKVAGEVRFSVGNVTRFYVPLLLQAFSQSLTYPLVAAIFVAPVCTTVAVYATLNLPRSVRTT